MSVLNLKNQSEKNKPRALGLLVFIMIVFGILAFKFTTGTSFEEHSVIDDLNGLVYSFQSLAYGDIDGFFDGFLSSVTVVGLFMVIFALVHFIFTKALASLFSKKLALVMSLVITVYAFIDHRIYNYLISLNAFVVGFLVFCAFVIMLWGFGKHSHANYKQSQLDFKKVKDVARQQYLSKGYVDGDIMKHLRKLQSELTDAKRKYEKDLDEA